MMNVLFLEERPRFVGGSERMSLALCRHAVSRGHSTWLAYREQGDMVPAYAAAGATCVQLPVIPMAVRHPRTVWRSFTTLRGLLSGARVDCLFTSQVNYVSLMAAVGRWTRTKTAVHLGLTYDYPSPVFRAGMRWIDLAVAPSEHTASGWRGRDWPEQSLRVIPNGVDLTVFNPGEGRAEARHRIGVASNEPLVAYVGRLVPEKGIFTLIRAFARYKRRGARGLLLLAGFAQTVQEQQLRRVAEEEGLSADQWELRPPTSRPEDVYRAADLVVTPSEWDEPFGLVPLEAMACGTLALVSDRGVLPTFVRQAGAEAVFAAGDPEGLAARLSHWLHDFARREAAAASVSAHVRATYGFERCGDAYLAAIEEMVRR